MYWAASDIGWVVGHSYIVYAPLLHGCTTVLYEGKPVGTPDAGAFWRVCAEHGVSVMFTAPTAIRAIKREDPVGRAPRRARSRRACGRCSWPASGAIRTRCTGPSEQLGRPVIDHWWQTESGWPIAANCVGIEPLPVKPGSPTKPVPGYDIRILDGDGRGAAGRGESGAVCVRLPLPPGLSPTLWGGDERFVEAYLSAYPGYYLTGDAGYFDEDGYLYVMSRIDDVINVAGHRLSTGQMEEVLAEHPDVAECAVVGVADSLKGQVPIGFVVLKAGVDRDRGRDRRRSWWPPSASGSGRSPRSRRSRIVARCPRPARARSLRATIRKIADGEEWSVPATIEDPAVLDDFQALLAPRM